MAFHCCATLNSVLFVYVKTTFLRVRGYHAQYRLVHLEILLGAPSYYNFNNNHLFERRVTS